MGKFKSMPAWMESLIVKALKEFVPASLVAEAFEAFKVELFAQLRALAADTANSVDDLLVDKVIELFSECTPDGQFLCDLVEKGEAAVVAFLRKMATQSPNKLDDAAVDILEAALNA